MQTSLHRLNEDIEESSCSKEECSGWRDEDVYKRGESHDNVRRSGLRYEIRPLKLEDLPPSLFVSFLL